ncbi:MAG: hypothetical protein H6Q31_1344 [Bacteroidetes bacterium]|jgi:hypothetical protein|nr:hypothetical protein [Bacteroidota bacterium]
MLLRSVYRPHFLRIPVICLTLSYFIISPIFSIYPSTSPFAPSASYPAAHSFSGQLAGDASLEDFPGFQSYTEKFERASEEQLRYRLC